jgi:hypothetical protein
MLDLLVHCAFLQLGSCHRRLHGDGLDILLTGNLISTSSDGVLITRVGDMVVAEAGFLGTGHVVVVAVVQDLRSVRERKDGLVRPCGKGEDCFASV